MGGKRSKGPASAPAQPDLVAAIYVVIDVDRNVANTGRVRTVIDIQGAQNCVDILQQAHARGEFAAAMSVFTDAVCAALAPKPDDAPSISASVGRA